MCEHSGAVGALRDDVCGGYRELLVVLLMRAEWLVLHFVLWWMQCYSIHTSQGLAHGLYVCMLMSQRKKNYLCIFNVSW